MATYKECLERAAQLHGRERGWLLEGRSVKLGDVIDNLTIDKSTTDCQFDGMSMSWPDNPLSPFLTLAPAPVFRASVVDESGTAHDLGEYPSAEAAETAGEAERRRVSLLVRGGALPVSRLVRGVNVIPANNL